MRVLQKVIHEGLFFVQAHIEQPPSRAYLRDMEQDLKSLPAWVKREGHNRAFVAIRKDNARMHKFVTQRGFHWLKEFGHLNIYKQNV